MDNQPSTQRPPRSRRRSRAGKKDEQEEVEQELDPLSRLVAKGWSKEDNLMADKIFLCGPLIVKGRLYATDKLCLRGDFVVTDRLECKGTLTLHGGLSCCGNVVVTSGAFIKGKCTINGKLTITGVIRVTGTLKCKDLDLTGHIEGFGDKPQVIVEGSSVVNGKDSLSDKLVRLLREHEASGQKQGASLPSNSMA